MTRDRVRKGIAQSCRFCHHESLRLAKRTNVLGGCVGKGTFEAGSTLGSAKKGSLAEEVTKCRVETIGCGWNALATI